MWAGVKEALDAAPESGAYDRMEETMDQLTAVPAPLLG